MTRVSTCRRLLVGSRLNGGVIRLLVTPPAGVSRIRLLNVPWALVCTTRIMPWALLILLLVMVPVKVHPSSVPLNPTYNAFPLFGLRRLKRTCGIPSWPMHVVMLVGNLVISVL